jgi:hypothetical protein
LPKNEDTLNYFKRYEKFYLQNDETCWRVEATDWVSTPGILEVTAVEYFANESEDDIENGIVGGKLEPVKDPNEDVPIEIMGETFIKVKKSYSYSFNGDLVDSWKVDKKYPVELLIDSQDPKKVTLKWSSSYSG